MATVLWFVGLLGLVIAAAVASARGRAGVSSGSRRRHVTSHGTEASDVVAGRSVIALAALAYLAVIVGAVWLWGGATARDGRVDRLREGASVHVAVTSVRIGFTHQTTIGHDAAAGLRVPGAGPAELARIEPGTAAIVRASSDRATIVAVPSGADPVAVATARRCTPDAAAYTLPHGATVVVVECEAGVPVRAFAVRRDHAALDVTPLVWHGRFTPERRTLRAGEVVRLGGLEDAIPGLVTWDVVAPGGAAAMLAIPLDPTECAGWSPEAGAVHAVHHGCAIVAGAFTLTAIPFVPDDSEVVDRAARAAFSIGTPPLLLLVVIAFARRRGRRARVVGRALRLCVVAGGVTALVCWRLLWAYRIDLMRELGARVVDNQLAAIAIGAAFAGAAVLALEVLDGRSSVQRITAVLAGWAAWLVVGAAVTGMSPPLTATGLGVLGLSLIAAFVPLLGELGGAPLRRLPTELVLGGIALGALAARAAGTHGTLAKLGLAYATVLAGHAALRTMLVHDTPWVRRATLAATLVLAAGGVAMLDTGVALAIVGVGLALAMIVAGHDAMYDASQAGMLGLLEREHARLLTVHGLATIALASTVATCAVVASDHSLFAYGALAVLHAPLVVAALFGLAAAVARSHRRNWAPWVAAALAALAVWGMRDAMLARATAGSGVAARRVSAVVEPGYALLRDDHAFVANASAWREAALAPTTALDRWNGQGYFGANVRDPGVVHSIDNDYLPVLVARDLGVAGLMQSVLLLLVVIVGGGAIASVRLRHASGEHRARWLVTAVAGTLVVYQPLASLGVLPLTGISWPGLGIDSPADLWVFVIGATWCLLGGDGATEDERVRRTPRVARARRVVLVALVLAGLAAVVIVARAGASALVRAASDDDRVETAVRYASSITCTSPGSGDAGTTIDEAVPLTIGGVPTDDATTRFDRELRIAWASQRPALVTALGGTPGLVAAPIEAAGEARPLDDKATDDDGDPAHATAAILALFQLQLPVHATPEPFAPSVPCPATARGWRLVRDGDACIATLDVGWPRVRLAVRPTATGGARASCAIELPDDAVSSLRGTARAPRPRIRVVSTPLGVSADDLGELVIGKRIVRLRPGAPALDLATLAPGPHQAGKVAIADVSLEVRPTPRGVVLRGPAELFVAEPEDPAAWHRTVHAAELVLDRVTLIVAGPPDHRMVMLFRPPRAWAGAPPVLDALLADTAGDRTHRIYPYGAALPELGWVNPYDVARSLGLDGWIHAALATPATPTTKLACGTLAPPAIARDQVCTASPLDGVTECRIMLQPQLVLTLRALADQILATPKPFTGHDTPPVRVSYVVLRGDTGELLAQGNAVPGRPALAYAPGDAAAEATLVQLRDEAGEADAERVEWNLPIAVGSTFKPIVARAAEQAFPQLTSRLTLTAAGGATGCRSRRGVHVDPIVGHCPPTSVAGNPTTADLHDFLQRSPNWYQAALGLIGLGLPAGQLAVKDQPVTVDEIIASDLASWSPDMALTISDATGPILGHRGVSIDGMRRTPLWTRIEALLGRPVCTLGNRARCERAGARADVCSARALPIAGPGPDLRNLVALGPDRLDLYAETRGTQSTVPVREYLQLLRGSGLHPIGSLAQLTDAFGRVVFDPSTGAPQLAASWFPAPAVGKVPTWSCKAATGHAATVLGADGGLCAVVQPAGTSHGALAELLADPHVVIYGAKTGTIDSLADLARSASACRTWNARHVAAARLECGKAPPDDSLFVIALGIVTPKGTIPITLGIQLQRGGKSAAARATPAFVHAISAYLRGS